MGQIQLNHSRHGWALLAMRLPQIRVLAGKWMLDELCESYSQVSLYLGKLSAANAPVEEIRDYEALRDSIEMEAEYFASVVDEVAAA